VPCTPMALTVAPADDGFFTKRSCGFHSSNINKRRSGGYNRTYFTGSRVTKGLNSSIGFNRDVTKCCRSFDAYRVY
jgi:hypothetical protein